MYRCQECKQIYNLYTRTMFQQHHLTPQQVVLLLHGILKGETTNELALRRELQKKAERLLPDTPVPDLEAVSDELFQNAEKKKVKSASARIERPVGKPTNGVDEAHMPMIARLCEAQLCDITRNLLHHRPE